MIIVKAVKYIFNSFVLVTLSDENHHRPPNEYKEYIMRIYTFAYRIYSLCRKKLNFGILFVVTVCGENKQ